MFPLPGSSLEPLDRRVTTTTTTIQVWRPPWQSLRRTRRDLLSWWPGSSTWLKLIRRRPFISLKIPGRQPPCSAEGIDVLYTEEHRSAASLATVPGWRLQRRREPGVSFSRRDRASHTHVLGASCRGPPPRGSRPGGWDRPRLVRSPPVWTGAAQLGAGPNSTLMDPADSPVKHPRLVPGRFSVPARATASTPRYVPRNHSPGIVCGRAQHDAERMAGCGEARGSLARTAPLWPKRTGPGASRPGCRTWRALRDGGGWGRRRSEPDMLREHSSRPAPRILTGQEKSSHSTVETGRKLRLNALGERGRGGVEDIRALSEATQDCLFLDHRETRIQYQDEGR